MTSEHRTPSRRTFLGAAIATAATSMLPVSAAQESAKNDLELCAFEKPLQLLSYDELADLLAELGFQGVEATVRKNGHIKPEQVEDELPKMHEALAKRKLGITVMTTDILRADDPLTQRVLKTAKELGVKRYRMANYRYHPRRGILAQLEAIRPVIKDLAAFNREVGILGLYQNHSGKSYVGSVIWDLHHLIHDIAPEDLGVAFDIRHTQIEASQSWENLYDLIKPRIGAVYFKDFIRKGRQVQHAPLGNEVDPKFYDMFLRDKLGVPASLHVEYIPHGKTKEAIEALRKDTALLKKYLKIAS